MPLTQLSEPDCASATAFAACNHPYIIHVITTWIDRADEERCKSWTSEAYEMLRPLDPANAYLNFISDEGHDRIRASFGDVTYRHLARLKARIDPGNRCAINQNIEPATDTWTPAAASTWAPAVRFPTNHDL